MSQRDNILRRLRAAPTPFVGIPAVPERQVMTPIEDTSPAALRERFAREAQALGGQVAAFTEANRAAEFILGLIAPDQAVQSWDFAHIPLPGLAEALTHAGIRVSNGDAAVRVGITGVDAALAGTGSLVLAAGPGKPRQASLVTPVHIAVLTADQIVPHLDFWAAAQRTDDFQRIRSASGVAVISGPSRTGDIANIPVWGVHGPGKLYIVIMRM
jgi:L-lactate dehydrogenase complex protein LldG